MSGGRSDRRSRRSRPRAGWLVPLCLAALAGCGRPHPSQQYQRPEQVLDFGRLYGQHCAGCHGADGRAGPAPPLNDPLYLAIVPDDELERVTAKGRPGTLMPEFGREHGGPLTREQVVALREGIRARWKAEPTPAGEPPLKWLVINDEQRAIAGDAHAGAKVFAAACARCHGDDGRGGKGAGAVNDPAFLALVSDQALWRTVVTGRPDLDPPMPDYRRQVAGTEPRPLTPREIADVTALLASWRLSPTVSNGAFKRGEN